MRQILILLILTTNVRLFAQDLRVSLEGKQGRSYLASTVWSIGEIKDTSLYKLIDTSQFLKWDIGVIPFNYAQYKLENAGFDLDDDYSFRKYLEKVPTKDTAYLVRSKIEGNLLTIFIGEVNEGEKLVILDENRNYDFTDDEVYRIKKNENKNIVKTFNFDIYDAQQIRTEPLFLQINPYSNFLIGGKQPIVDVYSQDYLEGILNVNDRKFLVQLNDRQHFYKPSSRISAELKVLELPVDSGGRYFNRTYKLSDTISAGSGSYLVELEGKSLKFNKIGEIENERSIPIFDEKDLLTSIVLDNEKFKGKYTLIDFWGTWCGPCIQSLPHLVALHKKYGDKLNMLSIASDNPKDLDKLKGLISKHELTWNHIWSDRSEKWSNSLPFKFEVSAFPTLILLDPQTDEIERFIGTNKLRNLDQRLELIFEK